MNTVKIIVKLKNDNGSVKFAVWATSINAAKEIVCKAENAPLNAIIYAKVAPLTISDIKYRLQDTCPHFFSRSTMRFFGQTMRDFKVLRHGEDKFYITAKFGNAAGKTERIFNPFTNELERLSN